MRGGGGGRKSRRRARWCLSTRVKLGRGFNEELKDNEEDKAE